MLRVLRGMSSPVLLVRQLSGRLLSWSSNGALTIWSYTTTDHITQGRVVQLGRDSARVKLAMGDNYICTVPHNMYHNNVFHNKHMFHNNHLSHNHQLCHNIQEREMVCAQLVQYEVILTETDSVQKLILISHL